MFTIPSLRARECTDTEKDALNLLFLAVPLLNVALPFVWKSFPFIFSADCVLMAVRVWGAVVCDSILLWKVPVLFKLLLCGVLYLPLLLIRQDSESRRVHIRSAGCVRMEGPDPGPC